VDAMTMQASSIQFSSVNNGSSVTVDYVSLMKQAKDLNPDFLMACVSQVSCHAIVAALKTINWVRIIMMKQR
jgi:hypothetical protein